MNRREIKFKVWCKENEEFIQFNKMGFLEDGSLWYAQGVDENEEETDPPYFENQNDWELMQYTGLKDKNGVEIYEGDIVKIDDYFNGEMNAKVVFEKGSFGFVGIDRRVIDVVNSNWNDDFLSASYLSWTYDHPDNELFNAIVIGNVYENPELLESEAK